jgi:probable HAF family extracellular repeat protein
MFLTKRWHGIIRLGSRRGSGQQSGRRRPVRQLSLEPLEDRCLLSRYNLTVIGPIPSSDSGGASGINNAAVVQVAGQNVNGHAYLWDSVHGMQDLGTVGNDAQSGAYAVNDAGQAVGVSYTKTITCPHHGEICYPTISSQHAFLWSSAQGLANIGTNDAASGINAAGEVSGTISSSVAGLWNGSWTKLGTLGGSPSSGAGINNYGQVAGYSWTSSGLEHAFLWTPATPGGTKGSMVDLGTFGGPNSWATAVNGQGYVIGQAQDIGNCDHPFLWRPAAANGTTGTLIDLNPLACDVVRGINNSAVVAGAAESSTGGRYPDGALYHAVLWQPGTNGSYAVSDLNSLIPTGTGWVLSSADAINDRGQIVVEATQNGSTYYALLLTPSTTTALAQRAASTHTISTPVSTQATASTWDPAVAAAAFRVSAQTAVPAGGSIHSAIASNPHSDPPVTGMGNVQAHSVERSSGALAPRATSRQAFDEVFADLGGSLADSPGIELVGTRLR